MSTEATSSASNAANGTRRVWKKVATTWTRPSGCSRRRTRTTSVMAAGFAEAHDIWRVTSEELSHEANDLGVDLGLGSGSRGRSNVGASAHGPAGAGDPHNPPTERSGGGRRARGHDVSRGLRFRRRSRETLSPWT